MRRLIGILLVAGIVTGVVMGSVWALQRRLVYFPHTTPLPPGAHVIDGARDVTLHTADGLDLTAWFVPPSGADTGLAVLFAHGNGGDAADRAGLAADIASRGLAVMLLEYRGYGGNPGTPSEEGLALDADAAVAALEELGYPPGRVILVGESLGTGVVAGAAVRHPPAAVVLRSPFTELGDVGAHHYPWLPVRQLLSDRYPVSEHLARVTAPVAVILGDRDTIVPPELSRRVANAATVVEVVEVPADHNDAALVGPPVVEAITRMVERVTAGR